MFRCDLYSNTAFLFSVEAPRLKQIRQIIKIQSVAAHICRTGLSYNLSTIGNIPIKTGFMSFDNGLTFTGSIR